MSRNYENKRKDEAEILASWDEAEQEKQIESLSDYDAREEVFRYSGGLMSPKQMHAWADLANTFPGSLISGNTIMREKTREEKLAQAVQNEWYRQN